MPSSYEKYPRGYGRKQAERIETLEAEVERLKAELRNQCGCREPIATCEFCDGTGIHVVDDTDPTTAPPTEGRHE